MTPKEMAELIVKTLDSKMARDMKLLRVTDVTVLADYFVICTATSTTQIKTLADEVEAVEESALETDSVAPAVTDVVAEAETPAEQ